MTERTLTASTRRAAALVGTAVAVLLMTGCGDDARSAAGATDETEPTGALVTRMDAARTQIGSAQEAMRIQAEAAEREARAEKAAGAAPGTL